MNTTILPPDKLSSSLPASWQTIFWILVTLAINAMAQPGGRICGFASRYRTYLRCSPLICAADMLSIMMRLVVTTFSLRLSFRESVGVLLHSRFDDDDDDNQANAEGDGIQALERMTWLRWLWFLLGTLPPAIKLASMKGVGWAQAWGMMFLGSWATNELLIIFAMLNQSFFTVSASRRVSWPGYEQTTRSAKYQRVQRWLDYCERSLAMASLIVHVVILNNVFRIVSRLLQNNAYPLSVAVMSQTYVSSLYILIVSMAVWVPVGLINFFFKQHCNSFAVFPLSLFLIMLGNMSANSLVFSMASYSSVTVWALSTAATSVILLFVQFVGRRFINIGRNLLVMSRDSIDGRFDIDYKACLALVFFLGTIVASLFWYGKIYDSSGTSVPVWTGVFG